MPRFTRCVVVAVLAWLVIGGGALMLRSTPAQAAADEKPRAKFEVYKDRGGEYRWRLRAQNTQLLASSGDSYKAKRDCLHAIDSVKKAAADAPVEELPEGQTPVKDDGTAPAKR
jgi:uncharacterized protein